MPYTYLQHYGVLGMHWGVRKDDGVKTTNSRMHNTHMKARQLKRKGESKIFKGLSKTNDLRSKYYTMKADATDSKREDAIYRSRAKTAKETSTTYKNMSKAVVSTRLDQKTFVEKSKAGRNFMAALALGYGGSVVLGVSTGLLTKSPVAATAVTMGSIRVADILAAQTVGNSINKAYDKEARR